MIELPQLSRVGVGCYRLTDESQVHSDAMQYALASGCNLFDTASNYSSGGSERLVGRVLAESEADVFVITKAGYIPPDDHSLLRELIANGLPQAEVVSLAAESAHSIHPDFLAHQMARSSWRLGRKQIDGFLLHNPEYYFDGGPGVARREEYYRRIKKAFEFLEESTVKGAIRYYGVSSNTLPLPEHVATATSLGELLRIAREVSCDSRFKLVEFPYNLIETGASERHHAAGVSLLEVARQGGIRTLGNRPLNAKSPEGVVRIATYDSEIREGDEERGQLVFDRCVDAIRTQLRRVRAQDEPMDFPLVRFISTDWMKLGSTDAVDRIFQGHFLTFVRHLYHGDPPPRETRLFAELQRHATLRARIIMTARAKMLRQDLVDQGMVHANDQRPLALLACESYLRAGIDHVLVGMTTPEYVAGLRSLFGSEVP